MRMCQKCRKTLAETKFYKKNNGEYTLFCKSCMTMHIDNFNPDTFKWILEQIDVPYIPEEWNRLRDNIYSRTPPEKINGTSVLGRYLGKMRMNQFNKFHWADSESLIERDEEARESAKEALEEFNKDMKEKFDNGEISEVEYKALTDPEELKVEEIYNNNNDITPMEEENNPFKEENFVSVEELPDITEGITEEDKVYLVTKWGNLYTLSDLVKMEANYREMEESFEINDADTRNTLIFICKTNLKMNNALDQSDIETYQKLSRVSDSLRKSANLTAAQKKGEGKAQEFDSIGQLVDYCEKTKGFIPEYDVSLSQDVLDVIIKDLKGYTEKLVKEDLGLAKEIEDYIKKKQITEQIKQTHDKEEYLGGYELTDNEMIEFTNEIDKAREDDLKIILKESEK